MRTVSFRLRVKTVYILLYISKEIFRIEEGHKGPQLECRLSTGNVSCKIIKIMSTRKPSTLMMSSSEYLFLESECSFIKYAFS